MPYGQGAEVSFIVDIWQQLTAYPSLAAAMDSILAAIVAYGNDQSLL